MKSLVIKKIASQPSAIEVSAVLDNDQVPFNVIDCVNWANYPYRPEVKFRVAHNGDFLFLNYQVDEEDIQAVADQDNGKVWEDSCVECFIAFSDREYYNIEANCIGKVLMSSRVSRENYMRVSDKLLQQIDRWSSVGSQPVRGLTGKWELSLVIPRAAFQATKIASFDGLQARGNFYKCGDLLKTPHFLSWSPIDCPKPNFHLPAFFGILQFTAKFGKEKS
ncbi:hypothetical protein FACS1894162_2500 [Bacteroidia bacterium]|nr:hypothetical protein FACS1894162_2500 [Bacteroidia bacterium]